jgi:hypothetical protein
VKRAICAASWSYGFADMKSWLCSMAGTVAFMTTMAATAQPQEALDAAKRLVVASGLAVSIKAYPKQVEQEVRAMRGQVPDELLDTLAAAGREGYSPAIVQADVVGVLAERFSLADMRKAIAWLETDVGRRVTRAEESATETLTPEALQAYAARTAGRPPGARRVELINGLIKATNAVEAIATFMESVALGLAVGVNATQPVQKRMPMAALRGRIRSAMPPEQVRAQLAESMPALMAYTYRDVSDADLAAYLSFNDSADGRRYNDALIGAFTEALTRASVRVGTLMEGGVGRKSI